MRKNHMIFARKYFNNKKKESKDYAEGKSHPQKEVRCFLRKEQ